MAQSLAPVEDVSKVETPKASHFTEPFEESETLSNNALGIDWGSHTFTLEPYLNGDTEIFEKGDAIIAVAETKNSSDSSSVRELLDTPPQYLKSWRLAAVITCLYFGTFLVAIDTSVLIVSVPTIATELNFLTSVAWISSGYTLTMTAFQPLFGSCYRLFKVEKVYLSCILVFEVGSILCAAAKTGPTFIIGRAIAGLGAAGVVQGALCIISHTVEFEKRPMYNGIVTSVFGIAICFGPILGGVLTDKATWRWCFWINLPVGAVTVVALLVFLRVKVHDDNLRILSFRKKVMKIDLLGTLLFVSAIVCLLLGLQYGGQEYPWNSAMIIGLLVGGGLLLLVFGLLQWRKGEEGLLPLSVLGQRSILGGFCTLLLLGAANVVICFYLPFYFQAVQGVDAITSGIRFIAYFLPLMVAVGVTGAIVSKWGHYVPLIILGELIMIAGTVCLIHLTPSTPTLQWAAFLTITGLGLGIAQQLPYTAVHVALAERDVPIGNALMVFSWLIGGAISVAIGQNICLNVLRTELPRLTSAITPDAAIAAGAFHLQDLGLAPEVLAVLRGVWNTAVTKAMLFSLAAACVVVPVSAGMEWKNSKKEGERRRLQRESGEKENRDTISRDSMV